MMRVLVLYASESEKTYCLVIFTSASFASQSAWGIECFAGFFLAKSQCSGVAGREAGVVPWKCDGVVGSKRRIKFG